MRLWIQEMIVELNSFSRIYPVGRRDLLWIQEMIVELNSFSRIYPDIRQLLADRQDLLISTVIKFHQSRH